MAATPERRGSELDKDEISQLVIDIGSDRMRSDVFSDASPSGCFLYRFPDNIWRNRSIRAPAVFGTTKQKCLMAYPAPISAQGLQQLLTQGRRTRSIGECASYFQQTPGVAEVEEIGNTFALITTSRRDYRIARGEPLHHGPVEKAMDYTEQVVVTARPRPRS
jgi:hypothetical protein